MIPCPVCDGGGLLDTHVDGVVECCHCDGHGVEKSTRRGRIVYAMELADPWRHPGYGLTAMDVWECVR